MKHHIEISTTACDHKASCSQDIAREKPDMTTIRSKGNSVAKTKLQPQELLTASKQILKHRYYQYLASGALTLVSTVKSVEIDTMFLSLIRTSSQISLQTRQQFNRKWHCSNRSSFDVEPVGDEQGLCCHKNLKRKPLPPSPNFKFLPFAQTVAL